jgi:hypothetical protein
MDVVYRNNPGLHSESYESHEYTPHNYWLLMQVVTPTGI